MSFFTWLRNWWKSGDQRGQTRRSRRFPRLRTWQLVVEQLEVRLTPATYNWVGASGGDWDTLANWQVCGVTATVLPGVGDNANFGTFSGTVTHATPASDTVNSLTGNLASLNISS